MFRKLLLLACMRQKVANQPDSSMRHSDVRVLDLFLPHDAPPHVFGLWFPRPISDDFALVPRAFADRYFSAVSAFHSCDGGSWPPREAWWQPDCGGGGFQESVLFRHLHANDVAYRPYPMFGYYTVQPQREGGGGSGGGDGERGDGNRCDGRTAADHDTTCILLGAAGLLPSDSR